MANKFKDTLLIGQTSFDMRGGLGVKEPLIEQTWADEQIYAQKLKLNEGKPLFVLHDGPPYANGSIHLGHALNKSLKDFIIRWKNASGNQAPYIMGWDTHGLPIEVAVTKTGVNRKTLPADQFRDLCRDYALEQVNHQAIQFARMGIFTNPQVRYLTLDHDYEMNELRLFKKMFTDGLIYRALKPIYWSPSSESALAESEVEYHDVKSPTVYVAVDLVGRDEKLIIWTTTPWTLPMNQLIAVGQNLEYVRVKATDQDGQTTTYIVANALLDHLKETLGWTDVELDGIFTGADMVGWKYLHPIYPDQESVVVIGHHVTADAGTGLVHIASGFGEDDYLIAKKAGVPVFAPMNDQGEITSELNDQELVGKFYEDTNKIITARLEASGKLLKLQFVKHSYPHDWRTKKPVIYRATLQWFIGLDAVKGQILDQAALVETYPAWAKQRLMQVLDDRKDWTISRQRLWGVPIIGFFDPEGQLVLDEAILEYATQQLETRGLNAWFTDEADSFLPEAYRGRNFRKEKDTLDVWFDSGTSALALQNRFPELTRPFDLYLEGNDQYRGWFNASMINSVIADGTGAYRRLISHGMTTDQNGHKMSKSLGNGIDPIEFANKNGADVLRLWVASTDYTDDQKIGPEILQQVSESYRKIRNTIRFILANLADFDPKQTPLSTNPVDRYALHQLSTFKQKVAEGYDNYKFSEVYNAVLNYVTKDLSAFYLDFIKDIIYVDAKDSTRRKEVQSVLYEMLWALIDALRPIIPHTIEEVYQHMDFEPNKAASVHLLDNREQSYFLAETELKPWIEVMQLREEVFKALELIRSEKLINKNFEATVEVMLNPEYAALSQIADLKTIFIVSELNFVNEIREPLVSGKIGKIKAFKHEGLKCARCWGIFDELVDDTELCDRCYGVVKALGWENDEPNKA